MKQKTENSRKCDMLCLIVQIHRQFITNGYLILSQLLTFCYAKRMAWPILRRHRPPISGPLSEPCTDFSADLAAHA